MLSEFQQAATNLSDLQREPDDLHGLRYRARSASTIAAWPGRDRCRLSREINFPTSFYSSTTFTNQFNAGQLAPGQFWYLVSNNCTQQFLLGTGCKGLGGLPANFFLANPITAFDQTFTNGMSSSYNALQAEIRRRLSRGIQFQANYTWSKVLSNSGITGSQSELDRTLDLNQPGYNRTRADFDIHQTLHLNGVYELPFGRGRRWLSHGILGKALEGWQTGGLWTSRSGIPMTFASGLGTVNRSGASTGNPAVPVGMSAAGVCSAVGVYKDPRAGSLVPSRQLHQLQHFRGVGAGTTLGANPTVLANPGPGSLGDHGLYKGCSGPESQSGRYELRQEDEDHRARCLRGTRRDVQLSSITRISVRRPRLTSITRGSAH